MAMSATTLADKLEATLTPVLGAVDRAALEAIAQAIIDEITQNAVTSGGDTIS